jgi:hypothetical protein
MCLSPCAQQLTTEAGSREFWSGCVTVCTCSFKMSRPATLVWKVALKKKIIFFSISPDSGDEAVLQTQPFVQPELISEKKNYLKPKS